MRKKKRDLLQRFKRKARLTYLKILRLEDPPDRIGRGAAIGVFMGIFPTFGLGALLSIGLAFVFKANKAAAVLGSFIMNPLTIPFFWSLSIIVGSLVLRQDSASIIAGFKGEGIWKGAEWAYFVFIAGNLIVSAAFAVAAHYSIKALVIRHRKHKAQKRLEKLKRQHHAH